MRYEFSAEGIRQSGRLFSGEVSYEALWAVRETKSLFILYFSSATAHLLPKRFFQDGNQEQAWRAFLEERISPKRIGKSGFLSMWL
jgi:hypothetical protein